MRYSRPATALSRNVIAAIACIPLAIGAGAWAEETRPPDATAAKPRDHDLAQSLAMTSTVQQPLNLLLTQAELRSVIRNYELRTGESFTDPVSEEEVLVTAPGVQAPMRDPSQDIGQGLFAPFWAIRNPRDAWRIFVPIPPKGPLKDEPPAPDPR